MSSTSKAFTACEGGWHLSRPSVLTSEHHRTPGSWLLSHELAWGSRQQFTSRAQPAQNAHPSSHWDTLDSNLQVAVRRTDRGPRQACNLCRPLLSCSHCPQGDSSYACHPLRVTCHLPTREADHLPPIPVLVVLQLAVTLWASDCRNGIAATATTATTACTRAFPA